MKALYLVGAGLLTAALVAACGSSDTGTLSNQGPNTGNGDPGSLQGGPNDQK